MLKEKEYELLIMVKPSLLQNSPSWPCDISITQNFREIYEDPRNYAADKRSTIALFSLTIGYQEAHLYICARSTGLDQYPAFI